jgi:hypothetical protein
MVAATLACAVGAEVQNYLQLSAPRTELNVRLGLTSSMLSIASSSASLIRARLTRLLMVPTAQSQIAAASS